MTDFESMSIDIARASLQTAIDTLFVYKWGAWLSTTSLVVSLIAAAIALFTLKKIAGQLESSQLNSLLILEQDMSVRRKRFTDIEQEIADLNGGKVTDSIVRNFDEAKESYLNSVERLASCILHGRFDESEMKADYRDFISNTVKVHKDDFHAGTSYRKILKLHEKWADS